MWIGTTLRYEASERSPTSTVCRRVVALPVSTAVTRTADASAGWTRDARSAGSSVVSSEAA